MAKKKKATKKKSAKKKSKTSKVTKKAKTKKAKTTKSKVKAAKTTKSKKAGSKKKAKKIAAIDTSKNRTPEEQVAVDQGTDKARELLAEVDQDILLEATEAPVDHECREPGCDNENIISGYCRLHYIKNWRKVKRKELLLKEGKLNRYIEELVAKYPDKYIEAIRQDLASDRDFSKVISDLDLDESVDEFESEDDSVDSVVGSIRRDLDDEGDSY